MSQGPFDRSLVASMLQHPDEQVLGVLGETVVQSVVAGHGLGRSVIVVTDRRVYVRGQVFEGGVGATVDMAASLTDVTAVWTSERDPFLARLVTVAGGITAVTMGWYGVFRAMDLPGELFWIVTALLGLAGLAVGVVRVVTPSWDGDEQVVAAKQSALQRGAGALVAMSATLAGGALMGPALAGLAFGAGLVALIGGGVAVWRGKHHTLTVDLVASRATVPAKFFGPAELARFRRVLLQAVQRARAQQARP